MHERRAVKRTWVGNLYTLIFRNVDQLLIVATLVAGLLILNYLG